MNYLLEKGVNVEGHDLKGRTALHKATEKDNIAVVQELLLHGAQFTKDIRGLFFIAFSSCGDVKVYAVKP